MSLKIPDDMQKGKVHTSNNFGDFEIVEYKGAKQVIIKFLETGHITETRAELIRCSTVRDPYKRLVHGIGYIGKGLYVSESKGVRCPIYSVWSSMLARCYSEVHQLKNPTYTGCSVCDEWHNFQNFATWYEANCPKDGKRYALDKDIKVKGNRVYSPNTCLVVTCTENSVAAHAKTYTFYSPNNVEVEIYNLSKFCREHGLSQGNMGAVSRGERKHHKGWTIIKARK